MKKILYCLLIIILFWGCEKNQLPVDANNGNVGEAANNLLAAGQYTTLLLEISVVGQYDIQQATINNLLQFLSARLNKPGGISYTVNYYQASGKEQFSLAEVRELETSVRKSFTTGTTIAVHILIADGIYEQNNVLGIAYRNTSICIFGKTIADNSGGLNQVSQSKLESAILQHEFGHLLGLVNNGSPMQNNHLDEKNGSHCTNADCLMYFQLQTTEMLSFLFSEPIPALDTDCLNDLQANGGK